MFDQLSVFNLQEEVIVAVGFFAFMGFIALLLITIYQRKELATIKNILANELFHEAIAKDFCSFDKKNTVSLDGSPLNFISDLLIEQFDHSKSRDLLIVEVFDTKRGNAFELIMCKKKENSLGERIALIEKKLSKSNSENTIDLTQF